MNELKFYRRESYEERKLRRFQQHPRKPRPSIPAPIDKDIDHMYVRLDGPAQSVCVQINDKLIIVKSLHNGNYQVTQFVEPS